MDNAVNQAAEKGFTETSGESVKYQNLNHRTPEFEVQLSQAMNAGIQGLQLIYLKLL